MRIAIAVLMVLHGVAHMPGFAASWRLAVLQGIPYHTTLFGGRMEVGDAGIRLVGMLWLLAGAAFAGVAVAALFDRPWWVAAAIGVTIVSLLLCAAELPAARIGLAVNVVLLVALVVVSRAGLLPSAP